LNVLSKRAATPTIIEINAKTTQGDSALAISNPAFSNDVFAGYDQVYGAPRSVAMTVQGTIGKTFALLAILSATAIWSWNAAAGNQLQPVVFPAALIGGFVLAMVTIFKPTAAPWTAPLYAGFEGVVLGALSSLIEHSGMKGTYPGIAMQAVSLTCATLFCMLFVYATGMIRVTDKLRAGIASATGAICLVYLTAMVLRLFGVSVPFLHTATPLGIGIGVVIVGVAAFNLLLDFDFIEKGARSAAPKHLEWYGAFGLILTLVWLYLEILRLLQQINSRSQR
jgi:uncharacterized YccA/Bax inhibitor family protein